MFVYRLETGMKMEIHHRQAPIIPVVLLLVSLRANSSHCPFIGIIRHFIHNTFPLINVMKSRHYHRLLCSQITHWTAPLKVKKIRIECYLPKLEEKRRSAILICILGSSSIWTYRILNICFVYFSCACLYKQTKNIRNSTRPNRWATKDISSTQNKHLNLHSWPKFKIVLVKKVRRKSYCFPLSTCLVKILGW